MRLTVIAIMVLAASLASADPRISASGGPGFGSGEEQLEPAKEVVLKWRQDPVFGGNAISSEFRTSDGYWAECADDFYCEDGAPIVLVGWFGIDWTSAGITSFVVRFLSDVPAPPYSHPGDLLYEHTFDVWDAIPFPAYDDLYYYEVGLPVAFEQVAGNVYWISIQAIHGGGQWYWNECIADHYWNDEGAIRSEYWSVPDWVPVSDLSAYTEFAFLLYADVTSPVDESSWGSIKAMFR
jgi:hypothetical protein